MRADPLAYAGHQVAHGFGRGQDVERWGEGAFVIEVAEPEFSAGKLPLLVFVILQKVKRQRENFTNCSPFREESGKCKGCCTQYNQINAPFQGERTCVSSVNSSNICVTFWCELALSRIFKLKQKQLPDFGAKPK